MESFGHIINLNKSATERLSENDVKKALSLLIKAEELITKTTPHNIKIFTMLNLSSCYFRLQNPLKALSILHIIAGEIEDQYMYACTLLNISSIQVYLQKFEEALDNSLKATKLLKTIDDNINTITAIVVAYRNIAVICEHLKQHQKSVKYDCKAREIAMLKLGPSNVLTMALEKYKISDIVGPSSINSPYSSGVSKDARESPLTSLRFLTGDRLQPMHKNSQYNWRHRDNSLSDKHRKTSNESFLVNYTQSSSPACDKKKPLKSFRHKNLKPLLEVNEDISSKISIVPIIPTNKKQIRIVSSKALRLGKIRNQAAVVIQKHIRRYLCRKKHLNYKKIGKINVNSEVLDYYKGDNFVEGKNDLDKVDEMEQTEFYVPEKNEIGTGTDGYLEDFDNFVNRDQEKLDVLPLILEDKGNEIFKGNKDDDDDDKNDKVHGSLKRDTGTLIPQDYNKHNIDIIEEEPEISSEGGSIFENTDSPRRSILSNSIKSKYDKSARIIQNAYRNHLKNKCNGLDPNTAIKSTVKIQRHYKVYRKIKLDKENLAAILIQKTFRMHSVKMIYKDIRDSVILIQRWYKSYKH
ncbi:hypothetical protein SteCoe_2868 [Stentor coeruleus]|uniref:Uncharacterized protein n=1 Tax=Stentor coeruleus TaxID=5963 RepID=A0A1R2CYM4_9CILI|nr:hypothetical protein SteCoe_2868 [Stentor coeruleus]